VVESSGDAGLHGVAMSGAAIADAMRRVANDEALRLELGRRGIEKTRSMTWDRCADSTRRAYLGS
jgi:hypothetical protein